MNPLKICSFAPAMVTFFALSLMGATLPAAVIVQTQTFGPADTSFNNEDLNPDLLQFDTQGGTRILDSVTIEVLSSITSSLSGEVQNFSSTTAATFFVQVNNASTSVSGVGLSTPISAFDSQLLFFSTPVPESATVIIPLQSETLTAMATVVLTDPAAMLPFIGGGILPDYTTTALATVNSEFLGQANGRINTTIITQGEATVTLTYNYHQTDLGVVPEPASLLVWSGLGLAFVGYRARRKRN